MGNIDRGKQNDTGDDGEQDDAAGSSLAHAISEVRQCACAAVVVVGGVHPLERGSNGGSLDIGLRGGGFWSKAANEVEPAETVRGELGGIHVRRPHLGGHPQVAIGVGVDLAETGRKNAEDFGLVDVVLTVAQRQEPADDRGIGIELALPAAVAKNDRGMDAEAGGIGSGKKVAKLRAHAEYVKEIRRNDVRQEQLRGTVRPGHQAAAAAHSGKAGEGRHALRESLILEVAEAALLVLRRRGKDAHQPSRIWHVHRMQPERVHQAENGRSGPEADGKREHGCQDEARGFVQLPQRMAKVAQELLEWGPAPCLAGALLNQGYITESAPGSVPGLFWRQSAFSLFFFF